MGDAMTQIVEDRQTGGAAAWVCIFLACEIALVGACALCGCTTSNLRKVYDAAGEYIPAEPAKPSAEPTAEQPAQPPAAPAVSTSGLRLLPDGKPDWTDVRWNEAVWKDDAYWYEGVKQ
jgi:hypothetical protein